MKKSLYTIFTLARINTRRVFRDRVALFFTIGFPLIFLFIFGNLNGGSGDASFKVAIINQSTTTFAKEYVQTATDSKLLKVNSEVTTLAQAEDRMGRSEIDATVTLPATFGEIQPGQTYPSGVATVVYTQNNQQSASALAAILSAQFKAINANFVTNVTPFSVETKQLSKNSLSQFDYTFAGLLGFAIIGMGIFGPINVFPELKKMGILRRLSTTPLKVWQYFTATMLGQVFVGLISLAALFIAAIVFFNLNVVGNYLELLFVLVIGIICILGIGLALGGWAKNERQVAPLSNIIVFPMLFLSGTFFPRFLMPEWLQNISTFIPLTPIIDSIRLIATEGKHLIDILPQIGLIGAWIVVIYFIAFRVFRWE